MAPFNTPTTVLCGFKERPESLLVQGDSRLPFTGRLLLTGFQGDRLYIGTATGNIHIYDLNEGTDAGAFMSSCPCVLTFDRSAEGVNPTATPVEIKTGISRKAIEQLGYIKDINSLVVLSGSSLLPACFAHPSILMSSQKLSQRCTRSLLSRHLQNSLRQRVLCRLPSIRACTMPLEFKVSIPPVLPRLEGFLLKRRRGRYHFQLLSQFSRWAVVGGWWFTPGKMGIIKGSG